MAITLSATTECLILTNNIQMMCFIVVGMHFCVVGVSCVM